MAPGGQLYNESRLTEYISRASRGLVEDPNIPLARHVLTEVQAGNVPSYASFYRGQSLYRLNFQATANFRRNPLAAILIPP